MIEILGIGRHDRLRTLLSSYVDGEVSPAEAARVESHLSGCDDCRRDLENMRATVGLLRAMPELDLPRSFLLTAEPEPVRRGWTIQWGGALATAAAAAVFLALIAGDLTGVFEQTGLDARGDAASVAATAVEAEMAVAADTAAGATMAASAAAEPVAESVAVPQVTLDSDQAEASDDSASDTADTADAGAAVAMAVPAPAVASLEEPAAESAIAPQAAAASAGSDDMMEGADLMPFAGSETAVVDTSIDVAEALAKDIPASDEASDAPAPTLAAEAPVSADDSLDSDAAEPPVSEDDSLASDAAVPQQLTFGTSAEDVAAGDDKTAGDGEVADTAISLPLWQLQIAAGALLALVLAATLGLMMRRRRAI